MDDHIHTSLMGRTAIMDVRSEPESDSVEFAVQRSAFPNRHQPPKAGRMTDVERCCPPHSLLNPSHHHTATHSMAPTRSSRPTHKRSHIQTEFSSRHGSQPYESRASTKANAIVVSSDDDEEKPTGMVIIPSSNDERILSPAKRLRTQARRCAKSKATDKRPVARERAPFAKPKVSRPATLANINSGVFGDPKTWEFGAPEANHIDLKEMFEQFRNDPILLHGQTPRQRAIKLREIEDMMNGMDSKAIGVSAPFSASAL